MLRQIIRIDQEKCNGCGLCVSACHEGAIGLVNGKAQLLREDYCDGLGNCLPACPTNAITFEQRDALQYDQAAVEQSKHVQGGCPGSRAKAFKREAAEIAPGVPSQLNQWPVQIKLVPVNAPYFQNADLLIAADCTAFAYGDFHLGFMKGKITLIGCPKLDEGDYAEKLTAIIRGNSLHSITVARMEVPCCGGIQRAVETAIENSGKAIPLEVVTFSTDGKILSIRRQ